MLRYGTMVKELNTSAVINAYARKCEGCISTSQVPKSRPVPRLICPRNGGSKCADKRSTGTHKRPSAAKGALQP